MRSRRLRESSFGWIEKRDHQLHARFFSIVCRKAHTADSFPERLIAAVLPSCLLSPKPFQWAKVEREASERKGWTTPQ
jgi:hypothetical protein